MSGRVPDKCPDLSFSDFETKTEFLNSIVCTLKNKIVVTFKKLGAEPNNSMNELNRVRQKLESVLTKFGN